MIGFFEKKRRMTGNVGMKIASYLLLCHPERSEGSGLVLLDSSQKSSE
jgi:hypothetical protein